MSCKIKIDTLKLFESNINRKFLYEEYHIVKIFDEAVNDIINKLDQNNSNDYFYSGWCFDNKNYRCIKSNIKKYHPIYIKNINDEYDLDIFSVKNRNDSDISDNDNIYITRNIAYKNSKAGLNHEFRHVIDMYITNKNLIKYETRDSKLDDTNIDDILLNEVKFYKQLLMLSEQRAFADAAIHYLNNIKNTEEYKNIFKYNSNKHTIISELVELSKEYNMVFAYKKMLRDLTIYFEIEKYYILYILYLIYNENIDDNTIIENFQNYNKLDINTVKKISKNLLEIVNKNVKDYFKYLYNIIATHLVIE